MIHRIGGIERTDKLVLVHPAHIINNFFINNIAYRIVVKSLDAYIEIQSTLIIIRQCRQRRQYVTGFVGLILISCKDVSTQCHIMRTHVRVFLNKELLFFLSQQRPFPIGNRIIHTVCLVIDENHALFRCLIFRQHIAGPESSQVLLYRTQHKLSLGLRGYGERYAHFLRISESCSGVCRNCLLIHIKVTTDIPIVSRCGIITRICAAIGVTVINNTFVRIPVDKITGCLHLYGIGTCCENQLLR